MTPHVDRRSGHVLVGGGGPVGVSLARFLTGQYAQVDFVSREIGGNAKWSNEFWRLFLHLDDPGVWRVLVGLGMIFHSLPFVKEEATGYLIEKTGRNIDKARRSLAALNKPEFNLLTADEKNYLCQLAEGAANIVLEGTDINDWRKGDYPYLHPEWEAGFYSSAGGKLYQAQERLESPEGQKNAEITYIFPGRPGHLKVATRQNNQTVMLDTTDLVLALGPWIHDLGLPPEIRLPPGKTELHSIVNVDFSDKLIRTIAEVTALRYFDPQFHNNVAALGLVDEQIPVSDENYEAVTASIEKNLRQQLISYAKNGPLIQNKNGAYITRSGPTLKTLFKQSGLTEEQFIEEGRWRRLMLGREGREEGDLTKWPPHLSATEEKNDKRRDEILSYSHGIIPPLDALLLTIDFLKEREASEWDEWKDTVKNSMRLQSGFYHVTSGIEVTKKNFIKYRPLLVRYLKRVSGFDLKRMTANKKQLTEAGVDPERLIDISHVVPGKKPIPLYLFRYPFAVYLMDKGQNDGQSGEVIATIVDADLPYMDVLKVNDGALIAIVGWLRGRGYMAGPGAADLLAKKIHEIKTGKYNPESTFGRFMSNFSFDRLYNPELMDRLLHERVLGGSGDI
ncbi:hypothetical protein HY214_04140 [Candidatus Roizmanbacteria bacterium]|nr:hypothetical protein [Candidatus Roizmanbacteria bacterium]